MCPIRLKSKTCQQIQNRVKKLDHFEPFQTLFWKGFFMAWAQLRRPDQNQELKLGWDSVKDCLWRSPFGKSLNADHAFLLAARAVSWVVAFQNPGFGFRKRNSPPRRSLLPFSFEVQWTLGVICNYTRISLGICNSISHKLSKELGSSPDSSCLIFIPRPELSGQEAIHSRVFSS